MNLLLLPGMDGTGLMFRPLLRHLPAGVTASVVRYPSDEPQTIEALAGLARAAAASEQPSVIVAESFSGLVACELLKRRPTNVCGVVFVAAFLSPPHPLLMRVLAAIPIMRCPGRLLGRLIARACLGPAREKETTDILAQALAEVNPRVLASRLRIMLNPPTPPIALDVPATYLQAADDRLVPPRCAAEFGAISPKLEIIPIPGPHLLLQSRPAECWNAMAASRAMKKIE